LAKTQGQTRGGITTLCPLVGLVLASAEFLSAYPKIKAK